MNDEHHQRIKTERLAKQAQQAQTVSDETTGETKT
eukprot:gene24162-1534_t